MKIRSASAALVLAFWASSGPAELPAIEVDPGNFILSADPGKSAVHALTLRTGRAEEKATLSVHDFSLDRKGNVSTADLPDGSRSAKAWCRLERADARARKGQDLKVSFTLSVPAGTPGGEYYAALDVAGEPEMGAVKDGFGVNTLVRRTIPVIVRVSGAAPRFAGRFLDAAVEVKDFVPVLSATFANASSASVSARVAVVIRDAERRILDRFYLRGEGTAQADGQVFLLPGNLRDFAARGHRKFPRGRYTAELLGEFGVGRPERTTRSVDFEIVEDPPAEADPLQDLETAPPALGLEIAPSGVQVRIVELRNRGFGPLSLVLKADRDWVDCFPDRALVEPGRAVKVRLTFRLPAGESPRQDVAVSLGLEGDPARPPKILKTALYATGALPKESVPIPQPGPRAK